jgi:hypothetical protein
MPFIFEDGLTEIFCSVLTPLAKVPRGDLLFMLCGNYAEIVRLLYALFRDGVLINEILRVLIPMKARHCDP